LKILVCGGRDFSDYSLVREVLGRFEGPVQLAHGGSRGADSLAGAYAIDRGWLVGRHTGGWLQTLTTFAPDVVVAFPGAEAMACIARKAGVEVLEVRTT